MYTSRTNFFDSLVGLFLCVSFLLGKTKNSKRIGESFASNPDVAQRKRFNETFSAQQLQGRIKKETVRGKTKEFLYTNFVNEIAVETAQLAIQSLTSFVLMIFLPSRCLEVL